MFTVLFSALALVAALHIGAVGAPSRSSNYHFYHHPIFLHGWPTPFAEHAIGGDYYDGDKGIWHRQGFLDQIDPRNWWSLQTTSAGAAVCDAILALALVAATAAAVRGFEKRRWSPFQFSIGDMLSLTATAAMVLGLIYLDEHLSVGEESVVGDMYVRLCDLPIFDRVMALFAIACAVWLIVSTVINRLGDTRAKSGSGDGD
jgi:hypothetical protein